MLVAEDGDDMQLCLLGPNGEAAPLLQVLGHPSSEIAGPAFSPDGTRLYFSSQRGGDGRGVTYEVTGPFRT
jgi:secreted PhoX family phosphatase